MNSYDDQAYHASLLNNIGNSKYDLLKFIALIDGEDSFEYGLYSWYIDDDEVDLFMREFWGDNPDETLGYIARWIEHKVATV